MTDVWQAENFDRKQMQSVLVVAVTTRTNLILTTSVYNVGTQQLACAGRSKSFDVNAVSQVASERANQMMRKMEQR